MVIARMSLCDKSLLLLEDEDLLLLLDEVEADRR